MDPIQLFEEFEYDERDRNLFAKGTLWKRWLRDYPQLFDKKDELIFQKQANMKNARYKYFECQAAVLLYEKYGYWSLLEKYAKKRDHPCKKRIVKLLNSPKLNEAIGHLQDEYKGHGPDLLVYTTDFTEWFFVEVKSDTDELKPKQRRKFIELVEIIRKPIRLVEFRPLPNFKTSR